MKATLINVLPVGFGKVMAIDKIVFQNDQVQRCQVLCKNWPGILELNVLEVWS